MDANSRWFESSSEPGDVSVAATYHQVWWPSTETVKFDGGHLPVWDEHTSTYLDPHTGEVLPAWDQALDAIGNQDEPLHVARFGDRCGWLGWLRRWCRVAGMGLRVHTVSDANVLARCCLPRL